MTGATPEESAFLEALKANPADDTTRLVYADWLDEHNEPRKAEYLRLVPAIASSEGDASNHLSAPKVVALAQNLPARWRFASASRFALILDWFSDHVKTVKWYRDITECGLGEAKTAVETSPTTVYACVPFEMARSAHKLSPGESNARVQILAATRCPPASADRFQASVQCTALRSPLAQSPHTEFENVVRAVLNRLFVAMGVPLTENNFLEALSGQEVVLIGDLTRDQARAITGELFATYLQHRSPAGWYLRCATRQSEATLNT